MSSDSVEYLKGIPCGTHTDVLEGGLLHGWLLGGEKGVLGKVAAGVARYISILATEKGTGRGTGDLTKRNLELFLSFELS